ncbi:hypothetical protein WA158_003061 [Blastocystis sp. Blastoise]
MFLSTVASSIRNEKLYQETVDNIENVLRDRFRFPVQINIALLGFNGIIDVSLFKKYLMDALSTYRPSLSESNHERDLEVEYKLSFEIAHLPISLLTKYENTLRQYFNEDYLRQPEKIRNLNLDPKYKVEVTEPTMKYIFSLVYKEIKNIFHIDEKNTIVPHTIFLLNPDRHACRPTDDVRTLTRSFSYTYSYKGVGSGQTFLSSDRYIVIDLTASKSLFGYQGDLYTYNDIYMHKDIKSKETLTYTNTIPIYDKTKSKEVFISDLVTMVYSCFQYILLSDPVHTFHNQQDQEIYIPLLVYTSSHHLERSKIEMIEKLVDQIQELIHKIIPENDSIFVIYDILLINDNMAVSLAIRRSMRIYRDIYEYIYDESNIPTKNYIDGHHLITLLNNITYIHKQHLFQKYKLPISYLDKPIKGVRIIPIYLIQLNIEEYNKDLILQNNDLFTIYDDSILVLSLNNKYISTEYIQEQKTVYIDGFNTMKYISQALYMELVYIYI